MQLPDTIDAIRPSIVQISAVGPNLPPQGRTLGTGFMVTDALHVVTAAHVVDAIDKAAGQSLRIGWPGPELDTPEFKVLGAFVHVDTAVIGTDPDHDLALLAAPQQIPRMTVAPVGTGPGDPPPRVVGPAYRPVQLNRARLRAGSQLAVSGFPLNEPSLVTSSGILASIFALRLPTGAPHQCYLGDFTANPGNSGGPVYVLNNASVVGVCVAGRAVPVFGGIGTFASGLTVIVPAADVITLLERHGLQPAQQARPPQSRRQPTNKKRR